MQFFLSSWNTKISLCNVVRCRSYVNVVDAFFQLSVKQMMVIYLPETLHTCTSSTDSPSHALKMVQSGNSLYPCVNLLTFVTYALIIYKCLYIFVLL